MATGDLPTAQIFSHDIYLLFINCKTSLFAYAKSAKLQRFWKSQEIFEQYQKQSNFLKKWLDGVYIIFFVNFSINNDFLIPKVFEFLISFQIKCWNIFLEFLIPFWVCWVLTRLSLSSGMSDSFLFSSFRALFVNVNLNRSFEGITHVICSVCKSTGVANEWAETKGKKINQQSCWPSHWWSKFGAQRNSSWLNYLVPVTLCVTFHR